MSKIKFNGGNTIFNANTIFVINILSKSCINKIECVE